MNCMSKRSYVMRGKWRSFKPPAVSYLLSHLPDAGQRNRERRPNARKDKHLQPKRTECRTQNWRVPAALHQPAFSPRPSTRASVWTTTTIRSVSAARSTSSPLSPSLQNRFLVSPTERLRHNSRSHRLRAVATERRNKTMYYISV